MTDHTPPPPGQFPPGMPTQPPGHQPVTPTPPSEPQKTSAGKTAGIVIGVVTATFALAGLIFGLTRPDSDDAVQTTTPPIVTDAEPLVTEPQADQPDTTVPAIPDPAVTEPAVTEPAVTEPIVTEPGDVTDPGAPSATDGTTAPTTVLVPDSTVAPSTGDTDLATVSLTELNRLLAWTSFSEASLDDAAQQVEVDQLLATRSVEAVAHPTAVSVLCVGIPVDAPLSFTISWERDGAIVTSEPFDAEVPGVGNCLDNGGAPLAAGAYQVFATDSVGSEVGYATTFVVGAVEVGQSFVNNTDFEICDIGVAPLATNYYELFTSTTGPILPGELINISVASIEQDLRVTTCDGDDLANLTFVPNAAAEQPMQ